MIAGMARLLPEDPPRLGPYRLLGRLGSGPAGHVYLGRGAPRRGARKERAAVRALRPEQLRDRQQRARIRQVADTVARGARSPYVAAAHGCDLDGERPWMAREFVPGPGLPALVGRYGPLPEEAVRALGGGLCRALAALHRSGVVHGDLAPGNVLLAADHPRVVDYGMSEGRHAPGDGRSPLPADDVFALGVVLAYAASARMPFAGSLLPSTRESADLSGVPEGLRPALTACLHKTPEARPLPAALARRLDLDDAAERPAASWLPGPWTHEIRTFAEAADGFGGRGLFRR
ncbi:protein kinase [Streptomyces sp. DSM 42041]|uniref:Protein kinase n=1 Tax=Streptomyces hazeniae TaxID=3075538 RepID=A0ABU2NR91_9ACTN|nr:protein kinase [Streptomyces sp. DSM 42041]MDT0378138.1 protein kinase [Streptomyces sp. DSM 42041]